MPGGQDSGVQIEHFFVLMMENRSYDHLFGYGNFQGWAPGHNGSGPKIQAEGLTGAESNPDSETGTYVHVSPTAPDSVGFDPDHEFPSVREQVCGPKGDYPNLTMNGFVDANGPAVMQCFDPLRIPVLSQLAADFAVFDHWYSALPGPTWPNRLFAMAATSGGLCCSPNAPTIAWQTTFGSYDFQHGNIFGNLETQGKKWRVYHQGIPMSLTLKGMGKKYLVGGEFKEYSDKNFRADLDNSYDAQFTFIEPHYGGLFDDWYWEGNSQHPNGNIQNGELLIRDVYAAIRNSNIWEKSLLLITYDEHGGFFDHVKPPQAVPPGDTEGYISQNPGKLFDFKIQGVRVPAVLVGPRIPRNTVVKDKYDHGSISKTVSEIFGVPTLTERDKAANGLAAISSLETPRTSEADAPTSLALAAPSETPVSSTVAMTEDEAQLQWARKQKVGGLGKLMLELAAQIKVILDQGDPDLQGTYDGLDLPPAKVAAAIQGINTRQGAADFMNGVHQRVLANKANVLKKGRP